MTAFSQLDPLWTILIAFTVIALGLMLVWRDLRGGRDGNSALLGQRIDMLHRIEGFRLTVFGLVLIGVGAAVIWRAQWLLLLAPHLRSRCPRWGRRRGAPGKRA